MSVVLEMGFNEPDIERRKKLVGLTSDDILGIIAIKEIVVNNAARDADAFFAFLKARSEAPALTDDQDLLTKARKLKEEHLIALVQGTYDQRYAQQRIRLGLMYSKVGLDTRAFLGAFHHVLKTIGASIMQRFAHAPIDGFEHFMSLKKVAFLDIGIIIDVLAFGRERTIRQQQESILELSTPVLRVRDRFLLLPIIGAIDTLRAELIAESLLRAIDGARARVVVIDITGASTIDTTVANRLLQTAAAANLMGASVILSGVSRKVAKALVTLGVNLENVQTVGSLERGLEEAERIASQQGPPDGVSESANTL